MSKLFKNKHFKQGVMYGALGGAILGVALLPNDLKDKIESMFDKFKGGQS